MSSPFDYPISQPHLSFMKLKKQKKKQKNKTKQKLEEGKTLVYLTIKKLIKYKHKPKTI